LLLVLAVVLVIMAWGDRDLAETLKRLAIPGAEPEATGSPYEVAFWMHLGMAAVEAGVAFAVVRTGDRIWFALAALTSALATASAAWMIWPRRQRCLR
jgi:hypothetical protein